MPEADQGKGFSAFADASRSAPRETVPALPDDGTLLRMYPPGSSPRAGALRSDWVDQDSHWHYHDMHQLIYAFEKAIVVESEAGSHLVPPQLAAWIPAGLMHRVSLHKVRSVSVFLTEEMIASAGTRVRTLLVSPLMREMLREAMRWPIEERSSPLRESYFAAMAGLCHEWIEEEADLLLPACQDDRVRRALDYTGRNIDARLPDVCAHAGLSERTLRRRLKAEAGMTWENWRQRSRLLRAVALLGDTETASMSIAVIAADCGFESPSAFAKAFRAIMGETPSAYRSRVLF